MDIEPINFRAVEFAEIAGWASDAHELALAALLKSCRKSGSVTPACKAALALGDNASREAARAFFETHYSPHTLEGYSSSGFVTGYYEPEVRGSREKVGAFQVPVYRRPDDLVTLVPDTYRARFNEQLTAMRREGNEFVPYYTREDIEAGALEGQDLELLYLDDPVELFFLQVQGSGLVRLSDGSTTRLSLCRQERLSLYLDRQVTGGARRDGPRRSFDGYSQGLAPGRSRTGQAAHAGEPVLHLLSRTLGA